MYKYMFHILSYVKEKQQTCGRKIIQAGKSETAKMFYTVCLRLK